jgi:DNA-binding NarL/FixJ family response regulator
MITTSPSRQLENEAKKVGIKGLCSKSELPCISTAIEAVMDGGTYFSEDAAA